MRLGLINYATDLMRFLSMDRVIQEEGVGGEGIGDTVRYNYYS